MAKSKAHIIWAIVLIMLLCSNHMLLGCGRSAPAQPSVAYSISLPNPAQQRITVQARFRGFQAGALDLVMLRQWAGYTGLSDQLTSLQIGSLQRFSSKPDVISASDLGLPQDVVRWRIQVPRSGALDLTYSLDLANRDGAVPSRVWNDHALLLTRSLFIFPADWLKKPLAPLRDSVKVTVQAPENWPVYAPWPLAPGRSEYLPKTVEDMIDSALALGRYEGYEMRDATFRARILLSPRVAAHKQAERRASDVGQNLLATYRFFGAAPNLGAAMDAMVVIVSDPEGAAIAEGMVLADNVLIARTSADLPPALDEVIRREAARLWIGGAIRTTPRWLPQSSDSAAWFTLGWADYVAWRIARESGQASPLQYWERVRKAARSLASTASPQSARDRGHVGAVLMDQYLRSDSQGARDLRAALAHLHRNQNYYVSGNLTTVQEIARQISAWAAKDYTPFFTTLQSNEALDLSGVAELSVPLSEARSVVTPDGLQLVYQWLDGPSARSAIYLSGEPGVPPYDVLYTLGSALQPLLDVAYLDMRGSGRSDDPGRRAYSVDAYVNDIEVLRAHLGARKVVLIGHAWGGYCALNYAMRYPERVDALILLAPIPSFPRWTRAALETLISQGASTAEVSSQARALAQKGVHTYADLTALTRLLVKAGAYGGSPEALQTSVRAAYSNYVKLSVLPERVPLQNEDILPTLVARDILLEYDLMAAPIVASYPVLILRGARDRVVPRSVLEPLREKLKGDLRDVPEAGYYLYLDNPRSVLAEIAAFLRARP